MRRASNRINAFKLVDADSIKMDRCGRFAADDFQVRQAPRHAQRIAPPTFSMPPGTLRIPTQGNASSEHKHGSRHLAVPDAFGNY